MRASALAAWRPAVQTARLQSLRGRAYSAFIPFSSSAVKFAASHVNVLGASLQTDLARRFFSSSVAFKSSPDSNSLEQVDRIRNVGIIAHVDHGKTTLVDALLKQSTTNELTEKTMRSTERVMDSNPLEQERGITILAKTTALEWRGHRINVVDTPGHGDFGGQVEQMLCGGVVDGVILLVDANEGVLAQTKFVLGKAIKSGLKPVVVINKVDRPDARVEEVESEIIELFLALDAKDDQLNYPLLYASGRQGWAIRNLNDTKRENLHCLLDAILENSASKVEIPAPRVKPTAPFAMRVAQLEHDRHLGRLMTGRIYAGSVKTGDRVKVMKPNNEVLEEARVLKVLSRVGLDRVPVDSASAGDIVSIAGVTAARVTDTISALAVEEALPAVPIDPPVLAVSIGPNDSPLAGKDGGTQMTSTKIRDRLIKESESNLSLEVRDSSYGSEQLEVRGRGEMQLGILLENMRREGFELSVSPPRVVYQTNEDGDRMEPIEEVTVDVDIEHSGPIIQNMSNRKAEVKEMKPSRGRSRIVFHVPARGLLGFRGELMTTTHGTGVMQSAFHGWEKYKGAMDKARKGALISTAEGSTTAYALDLVQARGALFVTPGTAVYRGMIVGEHSREGDLEVNPCKEKKLSNVRSVGHEEMIRLTPPRTPTLEDSISYVQADELIEVTPKNIRLRKRELDPNQRKRGSKEV